MDASAPVSSQPSPQRFRFADLTLDIGQRRLTRGDEAIPLSRLSFEFLRVLVEAAPNLVTHDTLAREVWGPTRVVSSENLAKRVLLLRQALDDKAEKPRYIEGVRGQGYRMLPVVEHLAEDPPAIRDVQPASSRRGIARKWQLAATAGVLVGIAAYGVFDRAVDPLRQRFEVSTEAPVESEMIAVLPFVVESTDTEDDYLIRGLGDELRNRLSVLPGIPVAGRSSSEFFRDSVAEPVTIAASLGVSMLIEGRVVARGGSLTVRVDVTDGRTGHHIWGDSFTSPVDGLLELQQEIVAAVVRQVAPHAEAMAISTALGTEDPVAHDRFLLARDYDQKVRDSQIIDVAGMYMAIELYQRAIEADPNFAEAHARLASALLFLGHSQEASHHILEAESRDPNSSDVQHTLALYRTTHRLPRIEEAYQTAISLNPNNADALEDYGVYLWHQGDNIRPESLFRRAIAIDPLAPFRYHRLGTFFAWNGRTEEALEVAATVERLFSNDEGYMLVTRIRELVGLLDEAIVSALRAREANPDRPDINWQLAELYARLGDFEAAYRYEPEESIQKLYWQRRYEDLIDLAADQILEGLGELKSLYLTAFSHNVLGAPEQAIRVYEQSVSAFAGEGMPEIAIHDSHTAESTEHLVHYAEALKAVGRDEDARAAAEWIVEFMDNHFETHNTVDWWATTYQVCALLVLDRDEEALELLGRISNSPGLPWYPLLKDSLCFQGVRHDTRYLDAIANIEGRIAEIRERLPRTLAAAGFESAAQAP